MLDEEDVGNNMPGNDFFPFICTKEEADDRGMNVEELGEVRPCS